jgi:glycosyltransferase involved in cell wall biosynthesis
LLRPLLQAPFQQARRRVWVDTRFALPDTLASNVDVIRVPPSMRERLQADAEITRQASAADLLLCLGNLPPLRRPACKTVVYLQNRYLIGPAKLHGTQLPERARLIVERIWLRTLASHAHLFLVQTPTMKQMLCEHLGLENNRVRVAPYLPCNIDWLRSLSDATELQSDQERPFLYVASGEPHKNHRLLVQAWRLLAAEGHFPRLQLTLDEGRFTALAAWITEQAREHSLRIEVNAAKSLETVDGLYCQARALVYPSLFESFGLPLIEARQAGLPVLAAEQDYVRDILDPEQSFDPHSAHSIARAVKRFMGIPENHLAACAAEQFLDMLWEECRP